MRLKYFILSILLLGGMDLFAQGSGGVYPVYDFAIRNAAEECFLALRAGDSEVYSMLLSEQASEEGSDFPVIVRSMSKLARAEVPSAVSSLTPLKPYIAYDYRYITLNDISYVVGMAVAEFKNPDTGVTYNMVARPLYFVYTDRGWKAFWIGRDWKQARFADKDKLVILDADNREVPIATMVGNLRDEFFSQLGGVSPKPQAKSEPAPQQQTKPQQSQSKPQQQPQKPQEQSKPKQSGSTQKTPSKTANDSNDTIGLIPYSLAEVKPTFQGEPAANFGSWVASQVNYPRSAREQELAGTAKIRFIIDPKGFVRNVTLVESSGKRTKEQFDEQVSWAEFLCDQYRSEVARLTKDTSVAIETVQKTQKLYDQALARLNRLKKLAQNKNYVLPEYAVLDEAAMRAVESSPLWEPGKYEGKAVPVEYTVSVKMKP